MPKVVDHAERRAQFVEATASLIAAGGISDLRIRDIAREAGFSPGLVAHYFTDQEDLLSETYRWAYRRQAGRFLVAAGAPGGLATLQRALVAILPTDDETEFDWRVRLAYQAQHRTSSQIQEVEKSSQQAFIAQIRRLLERARERGELGDGVEPPLEAMVLASLVTGLATGHLFDPESFDRRMVVRIIGSHLGTISVRPTTRNRSR